MRPRPGASDENMVATRIMTFQVNRERACGADGAQWPPECEPVQNREQSCQGTYQSADFRPIHSGQITVAATRIRPPQESRAKIEVSHEAELGWGLGTGVRACALWITGNLRRFSALRFVTGAE